MQHHIQPGIQNATDTDWICTTSPPCYDTTCRHDKQTLQLSLLRCEHPPAVQLTHAYTNGTKVFNHTFYRSGSITVQLDNKMVDLNVTLIHHPDVIGLMV